MGLKVVTLVLDCSLFSKTSFAGCRSPVKMRWEILCGSGSAVLICNHFSEWFGGFFFVFVF